MQRSSVPWMLRVLKRGLGIVYLQGRAGQDKAVSLLLAQCCGYHVLVGQVRYQAVSGAVEALLLSNTDFFTGSMPQRLELQDLHLEPLAAGQCQRLLRHIKAGMGWSAMLVSTWCCLT